MRTEEPKFSMRIDSDPSDQQLTFARQLGVRYVYTWVSDEQRNPAYLASLVDRVKNAGLTLYNIGSITLGKSPDIHLGLPERDARIEQFQEFLRMLAEVGVNVTTFTWEPDQVWSSPRSTNRGASARYVDMDDLRRKENTHGRRFEREELWDNFSYLQERLIPVAEETNVGLALHPNDPPTDEIAGIPCLIRSYTDYRRAFDIAGSPYLGMEFCTGCWLEGGESFGNIDTALREFSSEGRIFIVHFRNVSATLPEFTETFLDNGYKDMYIPMHILHETDYDGTIILDHTPLFFEDQPYPYAETAYAIAYMRALSERARAVS